MSLSVGDLIMHKRDKRVYILTPAYLRGAYDAQCGHPNGAHFYPHGPNYAQYNYGFKGELFGEHDEYDLPLEARDTLAGRLAEINKRFTSG